MAAIVDTPQAIDVSKYRALSGKSNLIPVLVDESVIEFADELARNGYADNWDSALSFLLENGMTWALEAYEAGSLETFGVCQHNALVSEQRTSSASRLM